jgi:hypothetical protein
MNWMAVMNLLRQQLFILCALDFQGSQTAGTAGVRMVPRGRTAPCVS